MVSILLLSRGCKEEPRPKGKGEDKGEWREKKKSKDHSQKKVRACDDLRLGVGRAKKMTRRRQGLHDRRRKRKKDDAKRKKKRQIADGFFSNKTGGAFCMGAIGGAVWHGVKGYRNSPYGERRIGGKSLIKTQDPAPRKASPKC